MPSSASPGAPSVALAKAVGAIPAEDALRGGCRYEPKWDGFRAVVERADSTVHIWSRQGRDLARYFPDLVGAALELVPPGFTIDGEAVVWTDGRLDFSALQSRLASGAKTLPTLVRQSPASFVAFDVLTVAGHDSRALPLDDRRALLKELASGWVAPMELSPSTSDFAQAETWFDELIPSGIEGLVVKGGAERYEGGKRQWLKVKHRDTLHVVCAAVTGSRSRPETLVVGLVLDGELRIVGRTVPLKAAASRSLGAQLHEPTSAHPWPAEVTTTTLDRFDGGRGLVELTLVEPVVVEISADIAWSGRAFRHAVRFIRLRLEMRPEEVEVPAFLSQGPLSGSEGVHLL